MRLQHKITGMRAVLDPGLVLTHPGKYEVAYDNGYIEFMRMEDICNTFTILYEQEKKVEQESPEVLASKYSAMHQTISADKPQLLQEYQRMLNDQARAIRGELESNKQSPVLSGNAEERNAIPLADGLLYYFPNALAAVAAVSVAGNKQHNLGPLHWDRSKSTNHADKILRHQIDAGTMDTDGTRHSAKVAWRALAQLEDELIEAGATPGKNARNSPNKEEHIERKGQADPLEQRGVSSGEANLRSPSRCC